MNRPKIITVWKFAEALVEAGILTKDQVNRTTRIVIDANPEHGFVQLYVQMIADERFLKVVQSLDGVEVTYVEEHQCDNPEPHEVPNDCITLPLSEEEFKRRYYADRSGNGEEEAEGQASANPEVATPLG